MAHTRMAVESLWVESDCLKVCPNTVVGIAAPSTECSASPIPCSTCSKEGLIFQFFK